MFYPNVNTRKQEKDMKITWYGQASFGIESTNGTRVVTLGI